MRSALRVVALLFVCFFVRELHACTADYGGTFRWPLDDPRFSADPNRCADDPNRSAEAVNDFGRYNAAGNYKYHTGIDMRSVANPDALTTPVYAAASGTVVKVTKVNGATYCGGGAMPNTTYAVSHGIGNSVIIAHPDGSYTLYGHLDCVWPSLQSGSSIARGARLGTVGFSTDQNVQNAGPGAHLHFEVKTGGTLGDPNSGGDGAFFGYTPDVPLGWGYRDPHEKIAPYTSTTITPVVVRNLTDGLSVRTGPGTVYAKIGSLALNQRFVAFEQSGGWYRIWLPNAGSAISGWIAGLYQNVAYSQQDTGTQLETYNLASTDRLYVRGSANASTNYANYYKNLASDAESNCQTAAIFIWPGQRFVQAGSSAGWYAFDLPVNRYANAPAAGCNYAGSNFSQGWSSGTYLRVVSGGGGGATAPSVTTGSAGSITTSSAALSGTVNPNGTSTTTAFDYGTTQSLGLSVAAQTLNGSSAQSISATISSLSCNQTYYYRAAATNSGGTTNGTILSFTTPACQTGLPIIGSTYVDNISMTGATLNTNVNPNGSDTWVNFYYDNSTKSTPIVDIGSGNGSVAIAQQITGLACGTQYSYRVITSNGSGNNQGPTLFFTTSACLAAPSIGTTFASNISATGATLNTEVNPNGSDAWVNFFYDNSTKSTAVVDIGSGTSPVPFAQNISGLTCGTQYSYRVITSNGGGNNQGPDQFFTTAACGSQPTGAAGEYATDANTVLLYHMNESGGSSIADSSGNALHGTATATSVVSGAFARGRRLTNDVNNVASQYISAGNSSALNPPALTFEAWIRMNTAPSAAANIIPIFGREDSYAGNIAYIFEVIDQCTAGGPANALHIYDGDVSLCSSTGLVTGRWYHVAFTLAASGGSKTAQIYIDGQLAGTQTVSGSMHTNAFTTYIGRRWGSSGGAPYNRGFDGDIDEVRVSNKVRAASEFHTVRQRAHADLNGDGMSDLVWRNGSTGEVAFWLMRGAEVSSASGLTPGTQWSVSGSGDLNGDGMADVVLRNANSGEIAIWLMNGATIIGGSSVTLSNVWLFAGIGDLDGDGKSDLIWRNTSTGETAMWLMNGGTIVGGGSIGVPLQWSVVGVGDLNGDGRADVIWRNPATGEIVYWFMNGGAVAGSASSSLPQTWTLGGVGDLNGDGMSDLIWRNTNTGETAMWFMNGATIIGGGGVNLSSAWIVGGVGDLNGDGMSDLIWRNTNTGETAMWLMNGASITGGGSVTYPVAWVVSAPK